MQKISLTDFVDVVSVAGTQKATKVRQIKNRNEYHPAFDFYKKIRDRIVEIHSNNLPKSALDDISDLITDSKKSDPYMNVADCYKKWWGRKSLQWFAPDHGIFQHHSIQVSVNPELGLSINGTKHLIKLYFKAEPLSKNKIDIITHVMSQTLNTEQKGCTASVLDIQNGKLISPTVPILGLEEALSAELAYISAFF